MTTARAGYSGQMARRIRCLQIGSFDCLIRGGIFTEEDALAIIPYLEIRYSGDGFCIASVRARHASEKTGWLHDAQLSPAECAARVMKVHTGNRGFVYHRSTQDDVVLFWSSSHERSHDAIHDMFAAASEELKSRYDVSLAYAVGGWRTRLVDAHESLAEAHSLLLRGGGTFDECHGASASDWAAESGDMPTEHVGLCPHEPVRTIQAYILENFRDPNLALSTIASRFRLTETYLSQLFKDQTGVNYSVFLEQNRIEEARRLLEQSELSISEVVARVGYHINSTFYRAFRRMYGVSPTGFRNQLCVRRKAARRGDAQLIAV